jgi:hypothetical protein
VIRRIVGQADLRDVHPAGEDALHRQPAVGALLVPDVDRGVGKRGDVVEDLAAEGERCDDRGACEKFILRVASLLNYSDRLLAPGIDAPCARGTRSPGPAFRLVQRELVAAPFELVAAVLQPVRPRDQHLPPARGAHLAGAVPINKVPAASRI